MQTYTIIISEEQLVLIQKVIDEVIVAFKMEIEKLKETAN